MNPHLCLHCVLALCGYVLYVVLLTHGNNRRTLSTDLQRLGKPPEYSNLSVMAM